MSVEYVMYLRRSSRGYLCAGSNLDVWLIDSYYSGGRSRTKGECTICGRNLSLLKDRTPYDHATQKEEYAERVRSK